MLTVGEVIKELYQSRRQRIRQVQPRIARRFSFVVLRGLTNVFLRTMNLTIIADKIYEGAPVIFVDFVDYDEIAHHAGPERPEAMRSLEGLDGILAALERVIADTPTHYEIVIWSDHGQSLGSTFEQLNGFTLGQRVDQLMDDAAGGGTVVESSTGDEWGPINTLITATVNAMRRGPKSGSGSKELVLGPDRPARTAGRSSDATPDDGSVPAVIVVGGGNLGTIWFPRLSTRPTLAQIEQHWPALVTGLLATPGVGVVMASAGGDACVVLAADGVRWIGGDRDGQIEGLDPMRAYDSRGIADLHRLTRLPRCADLVLLSTVDEAGDDPRLRRTGRQPRWPRRSAEPGIVHLPDRAAAGRRPAHRCGRRRGTAEFLWGGADPPAVAALADQVGRAARCPAGLFGRAGPRVAELSITWLGHSTLRIEVGGASVLTDPVLTHRVGPLSRAVPKPSVRQWADPDVVLLSHLHHDHAHIPSLIRTAPAPILTGAANRAWVIRHRLPGPHPDATPDDWVAITPVSASGWCAPITSHGRCPTAPTTPTASSSATTFPPAGTGSCGSPGTPRSTPRWTDSATSPVPTSTWPCCPSVAGGRACHRATSALPRPLQRQPSAAPVTSSASTTAPSTRAGGRPGTWSG
jgi:hypothetical protein